MAVLMLVVATVCWAFSFPVMKALTAHQQRLVPDTDSWFFSSLGVACRFGLAAVLLALWRVRGWRRLTRSEVEQGVGLGVFGSLGVVFQMDGLAHTSASTSAFLTQTYVLFLPLWQSLVERRPPSRTVLLACAAVLIGVAVLSGLRWDRLSLGRGEIQTLVASVLFTGQILWLQRARYEGNCPQHFSLVMFVVMLACALPIAWLAAPGSGAMLRAWTSGASLGLLLVLVLICTLGGYLLMNRWQRVVGATEAGVIYCLEPVFASSLALFLPAWLSALASIGYENEQITLRLLTGGALILLANLLVQGPALRNLRRRSDPGVCPPLPGP